MIGGKHDPDTRLVEAETHAAGTAEEVRGEVHVRIAGAEPLYERRKLLRRAAVVAVWRKLQKGPSDELDLVATRDRHSHPFCTAPA